MTETIIDKVAWTHIEGRKLLMVQPRGKSYFINPGGKREMLPDGSRLETDEECLDREVAQELSVRLLKPLTFDGPVKGPVLGKENTFVVDRCYRSAGYEGTLTLASELEGGSMRFFSYDEYAGQSFATPTGELALALYRKLGLIG